MKIMTHIARIIIAITFIFSGFVKLVDPIGSAIKFEEYFREDVLNLTFLIPYALPFAILLILVEIILGVMLLVGFKPKWTTWGIALLMLVFLFLTLYSAVTGKVTDCGCFGDAVKLSPWGTFYKNVVFSFLILFLLFQLKHIKPFWHVSFAKWVTFASLFISLFITYHVLQHLPIIDFRPYAVGNSIPEGMQFKEGQDIPDIHDFIFENDEEDFTDRILAAEHVLLIISYNISKADSPLFTHLKKVTDQAIEKGYEVYFISASSMGEFDALKQMYNWNFDMLYGDETTLKTMIRANPGIITLEKGIVAGKWNVSDAKRVKL